MVHLVSNSLLATLCAVTLGATSLASPQELSRETALGRGLTGGATGHCQVLQAFDGNLLVGFEHPTQPLFLELSPRSVRAEGFEVRVQLADGSWELAEPEPVRTYRGVVLGEEGSRVAASMNEGRLSARILLASGREWWIEPLDPSPQGQQHDLHVLYQSDQVLDTGRSCGAELLGPVGPGATWSPGSSSSSGATASQAGGAYGLAAGTTAEIACDTDFEYFSDYGSVGAVQTRIESVINSVNIQYERDVDITHAITTILVRSSSNDPYTKKPADQLLYQLRGEWNSNNAGIPRDVVHLFTGRSLSGSTIGIAFLSAVCNLDIAYGLVESDFNGNYASTTDLSAHELGHNWGANHCSCTSYTMNAYIVNANRFNPSGTIPTITAYRDSQSCFGTVQPPADPTSIHVASVAPGTNNAGQGRKNGTATVVIETDTGAGRAGVSVSGSFSGDFNESFSGVTDSSGSVTFTTSGQQKGNVNFTFCVTGVSGDLPYAPADNAETCDSL